MASCPNCGRPIVFHQQYDGKMIPLDRSTPVYGIVRMERNGKMVDYLVRTDLAIAAHFAKDCKPQS